MTQANETLIPSGWDDRVASEMDPVGQLVYASNLLGGDKRVTNFGGGNTSLKVAMPDPLSGQDVQVLWVKGSGGDLGSATRANFASLYMDRVLSLENLKSEKGLHEDAIVGLYNHCTFGLNPTACSIDTPLHAYVPFRAVSHMHSDAVIAIAASADSESLCQEIWQGDMGFLGWKRPGFDLGIQLRDLIVAQPGVKGALMQSHGFICWADDWKECYELTIRLINQAQEYIDRKRTGSPFGESLAVTVGEKFWEGFLPILRGKTAHNGQRLVATIDSSPEVLDFLSRSKRDKLAAMGTSCPDHFLRTKIRPMVFEAGGDLDASLAQFRSDYAAYYERCRRPDSPAMRNPNPSVVLVPGHGMVSLGKTPQEARVTGEFYRNAIRVMAGAETVSAYTSLPEQEAFDIEYWLLEEAKLKRQPPEKELSRQVALVTGAAQGIGRATALRLAALGACVVLLDRDKDKLDQTVKDVEDVCVPGGVLGIECDVTDEERLAGAFNDAETHYGGLDIVVVNAGNARRGTVADTSPEDYELLYSLLMKAYFDTMAQAVRRLRAQGLGGSIVVVGSKNGVAVGSNAALYSAAKAFELHLMRSVAVDHAKDGIRCNGVNPDAVVIGSGIWNDAWRCQTAESLGIQPDEIEAHYRNRTMLKVDVTPENVAEAVAWLASPARSGRTTGCVITVDGGNREGFLR